MATLKHTKVKPYWIPERIPFKSRTVDNSHIYNTARWRNDRLAHLNACDWVCVMCGGGANVSDHIVPIAQGGATWDWANRQSLCDTCHNIKSGREGAEATNNKGGRSKPSTK